MTGLLTAALLAALVFLVSLRRPQWGLLIVATLVPFHGLLLILPVTATFWKEAAVLAVVVGALLAPRERHRMTVLPWMRPALVLVAVGTVSALAVLGTQAAFPVKIAFFYLLPVAVVYYHPFTRADKDLLVTLLTGVGVVTALYGLWQQYAGGWALADMGYEWNEEIRYAGPLLRSFGTFNQPFPFGFFLMLVLVLGFAAALAEPGRLRSRLFWWLAPLLLLAMLTTVVRAAVVGLVVALLVLGVVLYRRLLAVLATLAGVGVLLLPMALVLDRSGALAALFSSTSLEDRRGHWSDTLPRMLVQPFGGGLGTTGAAAERLDEWGSPLDLPYQPDNQYLKIGLELGLPGLLLYAVVVAIAVVVLFRLLRVQTDALEQAVTAAALALTLAACVAGVFATYLEIFPLDFYFWFLLAIGASVPRTDTAQVVAWGPVHRASTSSRGQTKVSM